jgi:hypothetical protein
MSDEHHADREAASAPPLLDYASPRDRAIRRPSTIDYAMLGLGFLQLGVAVIFALGSLLVQDNGFYEIRDAVWYVRLAWWLQWGSWMFWAWALASGVAVQGAIRVGKVRTRLYAAYVAAWATVLIVGAISFWILARSDIRYRWNSTATGTLTNWESYAIDAHDYFTLAMLLLITNPAMILLAIRALVALTDRTQSPEAG